MVSAPSAGTPATPSATTPKTEPGQPAPNPGSTETSGEDRNNLETGAGASASQGGEDTSGGGPSGGARTPDEHREALDQKLGSSLFAFDAMLLKEQQQAAQKRAEHAAATGSEGGGSGEGSGGGAGGARGSESAAGGSRRADAQGEGREERTGSRDGREQDRATGSSRGGDRSTGGGRTTIAAPEGEPSVPSSENVPADVGDGKDDDVVARQIREAALQEQDPAIREKLWEEYRRYKAGRAGIGS
jgi:hypothetical protein